MDFVLTAIAVQSIGTCLVAFFLWQLGRAIHVRFVTSWALAAFTFSIALGFLYSVVSIDDYSWVTRTGFGVFMAGSYLMVFLLWSGLRECFQDRPFGIRNLLQFSPLIAFAFVAPWIGSGFGGIVTMHFCILGICFGAVLPATRFHEAGIRPSIGMRIVQVSLVLLAGLMFWHAYSSLGRDPALRWKHESFAVTVAIDAVAELLLVFGIVILACERVRDQLEIKNRELLLAKGELETVARTDGLTGLLNRRAFEEWPQLHEADEPVGCVAAIDLNDLKKLNDTHLHTAGDAALKLVARALLSRFRVTDPIFRIGGDEFVVVMPGGAAEELTRRMSAIDAELENRRIPGVPGPYTLRIAWGVAAYSPECRLERAFQFADRDMYAQKNRRKAQPPPTVPH